MFSKNSDVTLVITSCGRFDLLRQTLLSFFKNNTYALREVILIEDSGKKEVYEVIPESIRDHTTVIVNEKNIGQIKSIDKAYSLVKSDFIFHCEDDWAFCRGRFIEDSKSILNDKTIITVQLRDIENDIFKNYPFHSLGDKTVTDESVNYYTLLSSSSFRGFTFNPSLKRMSDYRRLGYYYRPGLNAGATECFLSNFYEVLGMTTAILENYAVHHIGWDDHILSTAELNEIKQKRGKKVKWLSMGFALGLVVGFCISFF